MRVVTGILKRLALAPPELGVGKSSADRGDVVVNLPGSPVPGNPVVENRGRPPTLEAVYASHFQYVWRTLRALGVAPAAVDDAVHEVFLVVQRRLPEFDGQRAQVTTWLYEIAIRIGLRYRTREQKDAQRYVCLATQQDEEGMHWSPSDIEQDAEHAERLVLARRALSTLDDTKRTVFVLAFVEQRTAPEIAEITGAPLNTVYTRIRAARRCFEEAVSQLSQVSEGNKA